LQSRPERLVTLLLCCVQPLQRLAFFSEYLGFIMASGAENPYILISRATGNFG